MSYECMYTNLGFFRYRWLSLCNVLNLVRAIPESNEELEGGAFSENFHDQKIILKTDTEASLGVL